MSDVEERFRASYWTLVHYVDTLRLRAWEERCLTLPQLRVLFQIRRQPGITTNVLARRLGLTAPTVSGLLDKLARTGLVERGRRAEDRRVIPLNLTEEGAATVGEIREGNRALLAALAADLGPDLERVTGALELLATCVERLQARAAGEQEEEQAAL
jgi:DNA-binding MarR family transcriptional regulator